jgi:hypothetical protein
MRVNADRTITVDETIQILPSQPGALSLVVAERPEGSHKVQYLVNHANLTVDKNTTVLNVQTTADGNLLANIPAEPTKGVLQIHVNYSALGVFTDKSGGSLGARSTLSWNLVPTHWNSKIESGLLEVGYPAGAVPAYTGATSGKGTSKITIEKTANTAFTGSVANFNVSEVRDGITLQPGSVDPDAGLHLLIAFMRKDLKPAPSRLTPPSAASTSHGAAQQSAAGKGSGTSEHRPDGASPSPAKEPRPTRSYLLIALPLAVPLAFFLAFQRRLSFIRGHGFATSAVPEGIGPAEAGYLLEGALRLRHVLGAVSAVVRGQYSQPDSATINPADLGPVERRAIEILKRKPSASEQKEIKAFLAGAVPELQNVLIQNLVSLNMLDAPNTTTRFLPLGIAGVGALLTGAMALHNDTVLGGATTAVAVIITVILGLSVSPLTDRGVRVKLKVVGLHKFLTAHASQLKSGADPDYLEPLRPYAVAFGLASEDVF